MGQVGLLSWSSVRLTLGKEVTGSTRTISVFPQVSSADSRLKVSPPHIISALKGWFKDCLINLFLEAAPSFPLERLRLRQFSGGLLDTFCNISTILRLFSILFSYFGKATRTSAQTAYCNDRQHKSDHFGLHLELVQSDTVTVCFCI